MKNKKIYFILLVSISIFASCATSRTGYRSTQRKGYGCPANASIENRIIEKNKI
ncbi:MAG: hypothetical protein ACJ75B_02030 [Flavisolibacter sp.]